MFGGSDPENCPFTPKRSRGLGQEEALMLGYMTERQAKANNFTHHGSYYGIPVWIGDPHGEFRVATKWAPFEFLMSAAHGIEGFLRAMFFPDSPPAFRFVVKRPIQ